MVRSILTIVAIGAATMALCKLAEEWRKRERLARQIRHELEAVRRAALLRLAA
jgi:hypothetical protein